MDLGVQCLYRAPDLIVEVAHPSITVDYGEVFLDVADYMVCYRKVSAFSGQKLVLELFKYIAVFSAFSKIKRYNKLFEVTPREQKKLHILKF